MKIKATNIQYDIGFEDVADMLDVDTEFILRCEEIEDKVSEKVEAIEATLPSELVVDVESVEDVADAISDETGFLVKSFNTELC